MPEARLHFFTRLCLVAVAMLLAAASVPPALAAADRGAERQGMVFHNVESQTKAFISYYKDIALSPKEMKVREAALSSIPAPCCDSYSAATCCCVCNLARSIWGLSNYLIHEESYSAGELKSTVLEWLAFTNPNGYSGNACFNGGCQRPFARDVCGGMEEGRLVM